MASHLLIINPASNRGRTERHIPAVVDRLQSAGVDVDVVQTTKPGDATSIVLERSDHYPTLIAAGGDGTIHETINGLMQLPQSRRPALAILPMGTGNDFIKAAGIPHDFEKAMAIVQRNSSIAIDVARIVVDHKHSRFFDNNVGIGFDAFVNLESLKIRYLWGMAIYMVAALKSVFKYRHPFVAYRFDSMERSTRILMLTVGNGVCAGGGFRLTPKARIDDGALDVCCIDSRGRTRMLMDMVRTMNGSHIDRSGVHYFKTRKIVVESDDGLPIHADGEVLAIAARHIEIEILPSSIRLIAD